MPGTQSPLTRAILLLLAASLAACNLPAATQSAGPSTTMTPFQPGAQPTSTNEPARAWWLSPDLPAAFREQTALPEDAQMAAEPTEAGFTIDIGSGEVISHWVYALVTPFPTITEEVSSRDLLAAWQGREAGPFAGVPLLLSPETLAAFTAWWGEPGTGAVQVVEAEQLLETAWAAQPAWALLPFEELAPRWKVLSVDGQSPIWKDFDANTYALSLPIGLSGAGETELAVPTSNRDADKLTTIVITGVTALVRATAWEMERKGITYPAEDVGPLMREADITHISNEVPFAENCPPPDPSQRTLIFCSDARYIELLEELGTDVVELTGDHFNDWTRAAMEYTLELYKERGWPYYGGGANIDEAKQPLLMEHNGNLIAFIGCNGKGGGYASAKEDYPGTWACDYTYMQETVSALAGEGYLVIATFQHNEVYTYVPQPGLIRDFGLVAGAGASIVSGSQAHQAHGVEFFDDDTLITYGLGNMFFDQIIFGYDTAHAMLVRHVVYDNRYISAELLPIVFVDYAKPRFLDAEERAEFLQIIFKNSIWRPRQTEEP